MVSATFTACAALVLVVAGVAAAGWIAFFVQRSASSTTSANGVQFASLATVLARDASASERTMRATYAKRVLRQTDFDEGTLRLTESGTYVLGEDIVFAPNAADDHRPVCARQPQYCAPAYQLGFFAAITVEAPDIVIDLDGHTLSASPLFALEQRFYSHIELTSQPFAPGEGPVGFGDAPVAADGVVVCNGHFGLSAHHAIHGNLPRRVTLRNLTMINYEVAAIALNGAEHVVIADVDMLGSRTDVPVIATYSQARILQHFVPLALASSAPAPTKAALRAANTRLLALVAAARADIVASGRIDRTRHAEAYELFASRTGVADANSYALLLHAKGMSVGPFNANGHSSERVHRTDALIERVRIAHTRAHVVEVVALAGDAMFRGPAGDILRIVSNDDAASPPALFDIEGAYRGSALSDTQLALSALVATLPAAERRRYATLSTDATLLAWYRDDAPLDAIVRDGRARYVRNGDSMFHVNKGVVAVRIDGVENVVLRDVDVVDTRNDGARGHLTPLPGEAALPLYVNGSDGGHPDQGTGDGYMGADVRGIVVAGARMVALERVRVDGVHAAVGLARGVDVFGHSRDVLLDSVSIRNVTTLLDAAAVASHGGALTLGLKTVAAIGLHEAQDATAIYRVNCSVTDVRTGMLGASLSDAGEADERLFDAVPRNIYEL